MWIFRRKKKEPEQRIELSGGLFLERPRNGEKQNPLLSCLPKGLLGFLVVFGSLGGFISAFDMECNYIIPAIVLFVSAMYFSGLFAFQKSYWKDLGYIVYFIIYVFSIYVLKSYVNSGFAAIVNIVRQRGELYFGLAAGTEFAENIEDRYLTITITIIFIGVFEIILMNIFLSNYMSLKFAVCIAMSLYVFPLYLQEEPGIFFVLCMFCGFAGIYVFKNNGHFKDGEFRRLDYEKAPGGKKLEIAYTQDNKVYRGVLLWVLSFVLVIGLCTVFYSETDFRRNYVENPYKTATREGVSGFLMIGFRAFFPNLYSRGGMSGGKLGDVSAVRPDNETDLVVRFAPYSSDPVYLRAYTGISYGDNEWLDGYALRGSSRGRSDYFFTESMAEEAFQLAELYEKGEEGQAKAVMEVRNMTADVFYEYYPYFTKFDDYKKYTDNKEELFVGGSVEEDQRFTFYPNIRYSARLTDFIGDELSSGVPDKAKELAINTPRIYEEVPVKNQQAVDRFIAEAGISAGDRDVVNKVVSHLESDYSYSYNPGKLPSGKDVVNYFLDENRKGVCYHFASAAVLIFRRLGIPARYVEGYAFNYNTVLGGTIREDLNYEDYYSGYSELGKTAVVEVEVKNSNAHAWVEIYVKGKGWIVVDPTPAASAEERAGGGFWNSITKLLENSPDVQIEGDLSGINLSFLKSNMVRLVVILLLVFAVLACLVIFLLRRLVRWRSWHTGDLSRNLLWYYREVCRRKSRRDEAFGRLSVPSEQMAYLFEARVEKQGRKLRGGKQKGREAEMVDEERVVRCLEEICFCPAEPSREDYEYVMGVLRRL